MSGYHRAGFEFALPPATFYTAMNSRRRGGMDHCWHSASRRVIYTVEHFVRHNESCIADHGRGDELRRLPMVLLSENTALDYRLGFIDDESTISAYGDASVGLIFRGRRSAQTH